MKSTKGTLKYQPRIIIFLSQLTRLNRDIPTFSILCFNFFKTQARENIPLHLGLTHLCPELKYVIRVCGRSSFVY